MLGCFGASFFVLGFRSGKTSDCFSQALGITAWLVKLGLFSASALLRFSAGIGTIIH